MSENQEDFEVQLDLPLDMIKKLESQAAEQGISVDQLVNASLLARINNDNQRREYVAIQMLKELIVSEHYDEDVAIEKSIRVANKFVATFDKEILCPEEK